MSKYVPPIEQLVTEIVVRDIKRSTAFYRRLGFTLLRDGGDFVELTWEDHRLFLAQISAFDGIEQVDLPSPRNSRLRIFALWFRTWMSIGKRRTKSAPG